MSATAAELQCAVVAPTIYTGDDGGSLAADKPAFGSSGEGDGVPKSKTDSLGRSSIVGGLLGKLERLTILIGSDQDAMSKIVLAGVPVGDAAGGGPPRPPALAVAGPAAIQESLSSAHGTNSAEPSEEASMEAAPESSAQLPSAVATGEETVMTAATAVATPGTGDAVQQQQQQQQWPETPPCSLYSQVRPVHVMAEVEVAASGNGHNGAAGAGTADAAAAAGGSSSSAEHEPADGGGAEEGVHASLQLFESVLQEVAMLAVRENGGADAQALPQGFDQPLADILLEEELLWITGGLAAAAAAAAAPPRTYALGEVMSNGAECGICLAAASAVAPVRLRLCCRLPVCQSCLGLYFATRVAEGSAAIQCPAAACGSHVAKDEVADCLSPELRSRYYRIIQSANCGPYAKTCPHCCHLHAVSAPMLAAPAVKRSGLKVACGVCCFSWCFPCHAPWHEGVTCSQFQEGGKALKLWAKEKHFGQVNARKCPKCKILIQRVAGCDHIHCKQCETDFCYRCGKQHVRVRFIGDHYDPLSILGCPYAFMQGRQQHLRRFVRGSIFTGQVLAVPVGVALAVGLLPVALAAVAIAGPVFGFIRLHRYLHQRKQASKLPRSRGKIEAS